MIKQKEFSYGCCFNQGLMPELKLIEKYQDYLDSVFFSTPEDHFDMNTSSYPIKAALTIKKLYRGDVTAITKDIMTAIDYARACDIKVNVTFNKPGISLEYLDQHKERILSFLEKVKPDEICCLPYQVGWFKANYGDCFFMRSFFAGDITDDEVKYPIFDSYTLRHKDIFNRIIPGKQTRMLINQACPDCCLGCNVPNINSVHTTLIDNEFIDLETYYARHNWGKRDLDLFRQYFGDIDYVFKISSRMPYGREVIDRYIGHLLNDDIKDIILDREVNQFSMIYSGLKNGSKASEISNQMIEDKFENFDWDKFYAAKTEWWQKLDPNIKY